MMKFLSLIHIFPIKEETGLTYASANENMHACGHDAHTAMLIATAVMLKNHEDELKGKVKLIFQPAEEGPGGAEPMVCLLYTSACAI